MALKLPSVAATRKGVVDAAAFDEKWVVLSDALDHIYAFRHATCSFQVLYHTVYTLVQHGHGAALYKKLTEKISKRVTEQKEVIQAATSANTRFLHTLSEQWELHALSTRRTLDIMAHLERGYCASQRVPKVERVAINTFASVVLGTVDIEEALRRAFFEAIEQARNGDASPPVMLLGAISGMLRQVSEGQGSKQYFTKVLEQPFLLLSAAFFEKEAAELMCTLPVPQYIEQYFRRFHEEQERTSTSMDTHTATKVCRALSSAFITAHGEAILANPTSGIKVMLRAWRLEDLQSLYRAFLNVHDSGQVISATCEYFREEGTRIVTDDENIANPIVFIEKLLELRGHLKTLLKDVYISESGGRGIDRLAEGAFHTMFGEIVNRQDFTADYLSRLLDSKLRSQLPDREIEKAADQVMSLFTRLTDKDHFENAYRGHLARRLLQGRGASMEDQERIFIQRLKEECGVAIASSLDGMFADRVASDELAEHFRDRLQERNETLPVNLHVFVLTAGFWPPPASLAMTLPPDADRAAQVFRMFYLGRHSGRKFEYSFANGHADIRLNFKGKRYELNVPTVCMPVLMAFQGDEVLTVEAIAVACGLPVPHAAKAVASLARNTSTSTGVLIADGSSTAGPAPPAGRAAPITPSTAVKFNTGFKSKNLKVRVNIAVSAKERDGIGLAPNKQREQLDEDRKYKVDAALVRIMKSRKILDHTTLVNEVVGVLKTFCPSPDLIKKRIEHLIEREFLERTDERNVYSYLA